MAESDAGLSARMRIIPLRLMKPASTWSPSGITGNGLAREAAVSNWTAQ